MQMIAVSENVTIVIDDLMEKYVDVLVSQSLREDLKGKTVAEIPTEQLENLLASRAIYCQLYGPQYEEEEVILPKLIKLIDIKLKTEDCKK